MTRSSRFERPSLARLAWTGSFALVSAIQCLASGDRPTEVAINQPAVSSVFPLSVQAGREIEVGFSGNYLDRVQRIRCECDDVTAKIKRGSPLDVEALIRADESAPPGPRFLYLVTPKGPSNRILFRVTGWNSAPELEPNDGYEQSQPVTTPVVIDGRIKTVHDSDMFRFRVEKGERLAFNVLTGRNKAPGHVVAILMTAEGRVLARNLSYFGTDPYLDHVFDAAGEYILTIIPRRFSDFYTILSDEQEINWQYQVAIGRSPVLWSLFPMGGQRGTKAEVELRADFLNTASVPQFSGDGISASIARLDNPCDCLYRLSLDIAEDAPLGIQHLTFPDRSGMVMPLAFAVGDTAEITELEPNDDLGHARPITVPVVLNGRIDRPGDRDGVLFTVDQYDEIAFRVDAKGLGSHITDPNLTLARPDGELIDRGDDRCTKCGPFYNSLRKKEKLDSKFWHYFQTGNPNDADAAGDYVLQLRDNSKRGGPNNTYRLLIWNKAPDFRLGALSGSVRGPLGGVAKIPVAVRGEEGFRGAVKILAKGLPPSLTARPLTLWTDSPSGTLEIEHDAAAEWPGAGTEWAQARIQVLGTAEIGGKEVTRRAELPFFYTEDGAGYNEIPQTEVLVTFVEPPQFALGIEQPFRGFRMDLAKGGRVDVPVSVSRSRGFEGILNLQPVEFPPGLLLEADSEQDGVINLALVAIPDEIERRPHRIAIRATARQGGTNVTEVTRGFTLQVK